MGKNVYAAPRKGPAGKWVDQPDTKAFVKDQAQERKERLMALANKHKQNQSKKAEEQKVEE